MRRLLAFLALPILAAASAAAQSPPPDGPVAVVVAIATPAGASRAFLEAGIAKAVPQYRQVPGLLRKYFTIGDGTFGGVYLFASRAAADRWFSPTWHQRVVATYGHDGAVTFFDVPIVLDNGAVPQAALATN